MRVAVVADIGQPIYHVGDEAIGHAVHDELVARGVRPVLLTRDVDHTRERFAGAEVAPTIVFPWPPADRERYLGEIADVLAGRRDALPAHDQVFALIETLSGVDAVLIAGGGNLNSRYGWLLYERAAIALIAQHLGKPVVLTGQTLGPALTAHDRRTLAALLEACSVISVREATSTRLARDLVPTHPHLAGGLDDAAAWRLDPSMQESPLADTQGTFRAGPNESPSSESSLSVAPPALGHTTPHATHRTTTHPRIVATFAPDCGPLGHDEAVDLIAALLDHLVARFDARVELLPHMATPGHDDGDVAFHRAIAAASTSGGVRALDLTDAGRTVDGTAEADLVLTTRYHPAVFAAARGIPVAALAVDHYGHVRIDGALANHGLAGWTIPLPALRDGSATAAVAAVWGASYGVRDHLATHNPTLFAAHARRWDALVAALAGRPVPLTALPTPPTLTPPDAVATARRLHGRGLSAGFRTQQDALEAERAESHEHERRRLIDARRAESPGPGRFSRARALVPAPLRAVARGVRSALRSAARG